MPEKILADYSGMTIWFPKIFGITQKKPPHRGGFCFSNLEVLIITTKTQETVF